MPAGCTLQGCFTNTSDIVNSKLNLLVQQTILFCCGLSLEPNQNLYRHRFFPPCWSSPHPTPSFIKPLLWIAGKIELWLVFLFTPTLCSFHPHYFFLPWSWPCPRVPKPATFYPVSRYLILPPLTYLSILLSRKVKPSYLTHPKTLQQP